MWYCNKCCWWYEDSEAVVKHFLVMHSPPRFQKMDGAMDLTKQRVEGLLPVPKKKINSSMRTNIFPLLCKKKNEGERPKNAVKRPADNAAFVPVKKKCPAGNASPQQNSSVPLPRNSVPPKKIQMHMTSMKDPKFVHKLMTKKIGAEDLFDQIKTYICKFCCRRFTNPNTLKLHLLTHKDNPVHKCHICGFMVSTFSALMAHYVKHSGIKNFGASDVPSKNESASLTKSASPKKSPEKNKSGILCTKCNRTFSTKANFSTHYCPPLNKKTEYVCTYCRQVTFTVEEYRDHIQSHSTAHLVCGHCAVKFETRSGLQAHFKTCKKRAISGVGLPKKVMPVAKHISSLSGLRFRKIKPKTEDLPPDGSNKDNQTPSSCNTSKKEPVVVKQEPLSPVAKTSLETNDDDIELNIISEDESGSRRCRSQRLKSGRVSTAPVQLVADGLPTRRSARLVNRKPVKFSQGSSDSEIEEVDSYEETRSPRRQRSPVKHVEATVPCETSPVPKKTKSPNLKSPKKEPTQHSVSKSPKASKTDNLPLDLQPKNEVEIEVAKVLGMLPEEEEEEKEITNKDIKDDIVPKPAVSQGSPNKESKILKSPKAAKGAKNQASPAKSKKKKNLIKTDVKVVETDAEEEPNKQMTLVCNLCSLIFRSKGSLKRHRKMHSGKPQFSCQYCGKFFFRKDIHRRHEGNVHLTEEDKKLLCYYCKEAFTDSLKLKEHAYEIHASRAMAPERIRRCTFTKPATAPKVKVDSDSSTVKVELDASQDDPSKGCPKVTEKKEESSEPDEDKKCTYNCGACNIIFSNPTELVNHFNEVHIASDIVELKKENIDKPENSCPPKDTKKLIIKKTAESKTNSFTSKKARMQEGQASTPIPVTKQTNVPKKGSVQNASKSSTSDEQSECLLNMEQATNDKCYLRCAVGVGTECLACDSEAGHKAVEWYQCQICTVSGPSAKMKEHMLKHMTKIGIFVVSCENEEFNKLTTKPPFSSDNCETSTSSSQEFDESRSAFLKFPLETEITRNVHYPAKPICSLMSEVKCYRCQEEFVDFDLLRNHQCLEIDQKFSCFIENCEYTSSDRTEALNHLEESHYDPLYDDGRVESITDNNDITCEIVDYDALELRIDESENIMVEPCLEFITHS